MAIVLALTTKMSSPQSLITRRKRFTLRLPSPPVFNLIWFIPDKNKETRTKVESYLFPFLLWLVRNRHKTHGRALPTAEPPCFQTDSVHSGFKRKKQFGIREKEKINNLVAA